MGVTHALNIIKDIITLLVQEDEIKRSVKEFTSKSVLCIYSITIFAKAVLKSLSFKNAFDGIVYYNNSWKNYSDVSKTENGV